MMTFIIQNLGTIVVSLVIAALIVLVIRRMKKNKGCGCGCGDCEMSDICHK